ncbi:hypothetical protein HLPCO_001491 [Haloplasma contractile SSD-17B]|uniref:Uncharacterized protein n=1 Tax=Haloplasma contractile SSD-17B TaxID=1033810 RepID=U2FI72_9MOLU|nr:hypothetical protein HLPCO_001491 [Haloplasma contractile SSD-17B]
MLCLIIKGKILSYSENRFKSIQKENELSRSLYMVHDVNIYPERNKLIGSISIGLTISLVGFSLFFISPYHIKWVRIFKLNSRLLKVES